MEFPDVTVRQREELVIRCVPVSGILIQECIFEVGSTYRDGVCSRCKAAYVETAHCSWLELIGRICSRITRRDINGDAAQDRELEKLVRVGIERSALFALRSSVTDTDDSGRRGSYGE